MATSKSATREAATDVDTANGQAAVADATRQQMASTASALSAMLRSLDGYQQAQQHMLQRAAVLQEQTAERLRAASTPMELMAIQSSLMMSGWTEMAQYTQELVVAAMKAQGEILRPGESQPSPATPTAETAAPLFQAWQAMFTAPLQAGNASRRHH